MKQLKMHLNPNGFYFLYVFENSLVEDPHYDIRHWNFIRQSLVDLNTDLKKYNSKVLCVQTEVVSAFNQLFNTYKINTVFSHQETGLLITYNRDRDFARYCRNNSIEWVENSNNGVLRGLLNREDWFEKWDDYMHKPLIKNEFKDANFISIQEITELEKYFQSVDLETPKHEYFQKGGTKTARRYADTFLEKRHEKYMFNISKPDLARRKLQSFIALHCLG